MINNLSFRSEFTGNVSLTSFGFNPHKENNSASNLQFYRSNKDGDRKVKLTVTGAALAGHVTRQLLPLAAVHRIMANEFYLQLGGRSHLRLQNNGRFNSWEAMLCAHLKRAK